MYMKKSEKVIEMREIKIRVADWVTEEMLRDVLKNGGIGKPVLVRR